MRVSEHLSVCLYVCMFVCHLNIVCALCACAKFHSQNLRLPLPVSAFHFFFACVFAVLLCVQKEQKSLSASPLASKTAQNPCRFLSLPSFVTTPAAAAAAAAAPRPCNAYLNVCAKVFADFDYDCDNPLVFFYFQWYADH